MKNTVLITGGTSGIGLALAVRYQRSGDCVIICGRDPEKLAKAAAEHPGLETVLCDVSMEADRVKLLAIRKAWQTVRGARWRKLHGSTRNTRRPRRMPGIPLNAAPMPNSGYTDICR